MKSLRIPFLIVSAVLVSALSAHARLASAKVLSVDGYASKSVAGESTSRLKAGDILGEGSSISVAAVSEVELVFSNGSLLTLRENTSITLAELQQQSFGAGQSYEQLEADPSPSQTLVELNYGKVDGHVKSLRQDSKFHIDTPLGTAAIRGTIFFVELRYNAERGEFLLRVRNITGLVDIISRYAGVAVYDDNVADKQYDGTLQEATVDIIPPRSLLIIRLSKFDRNFLSIIDPSKNIAPTESGSASFIVVTPGTPDIVPTDPGTIVVSPNEDDDDDNTSTSNTSQAVQVLGNGG